MFWALLFYMFFIFKPAVLADDVSISWISVPSSASYNTQFDLQVQVTGIAGTTYYLRADDGKDCTMQLKKESTGDWSNSCNVGISEMQSITIDNSGSGKEILRLKEVSSSGSKTLYSYVYDANKTLLSTSPSSSITINAITPTPTITSTPTPTPTLAVTLTPTPTPTKILTPTPTSAPVIEPTVILEPTVAMVSEGITQTPVDSSKKSKSFADYLPIILVILGLVMFIGPVFGPKIVEKIKSKRKGPPQEPSQLLEHFKSQQPTSVREITSDGEDIPLER
ncbi:MAG: hypothetical protein PHS06_03465 [Candidatus Shapirobacteria bacterium]|nr:hypothetical protein [Candidatus Shapirobacteria bacterium]